MSAPSFKLRLPPASLFKFPPDANPPALPPPTNVRTFASPFAINAKLYNDVLDWKVPVTIGFVYMTSAILMNKVNRDRKNVPFAFTKTAAFHYFVIAHNVFLAVFSALTFFGMIRALAHTWPGRRDLAVFGKYWPGVRTQNGLAGAADALCKLHGPRDLGDAVFYNSNKNTWDTTNRNIKLAFTRTPDGSDVGRLWNEGLAFWGWWFYLSKFYEVLDTFIILAKGKRSSTLQTYHHTGAMACMWAGIRFMSPPIWMFCFLNSGIHTLMYTYYTLAALRVRVPQRIKRTLTTMQISQFLIGITFASLHLFVYYSVPVATPFTKTVGKAVSAGASAVSSAASEVASKAPEVAAAAVPSIASFVKKILLRAAGEEGMAQRISETSSFADLLSNAPGSTNSPKSHKYHNHHQNQNRTTTTWRTQYTYVPCIDTTGQAFAIWLNLFYLAPLTLLFTRFFIRSYTRRGTKNKQSKPVAQIKDSLKDAAKETDQKLDDAGKSAEDNLEDLTNNASKKLKNAGNNASDQIKNAKDNAPEKLKNVGNNASNKIKNAKDNASENLKNAKDNASENLKNAGNTISEKIKDAKDNAKDNATNKTKQTNKGSGKDESSGTDGANTNVKSDKTNNKIDVTTTNPRGVSQDTDRSVSSSKSDPSQTKQSQAEKSNLQDTGNDLVGKAKNFENEAENKATTVAKELGDQGSKVAESVGNLAGDAKKKIDESMSQSKLLEGESFSMVDPKELDSSMIGNDHSEEEEHGKESDSPSLLQKIEDHEAPTFAEAADSNESSGEGKPDLQARSNSSRSQESQRSSSPSKKGKSKIPQPKPRGSISPVKKVLTPAKATTSMSAHSGTALVDKDDSPIGKA